MERAGVIATPALSLELVLEAEEPLLVEEGFVSGWVVLTMQLLRPLMAPLSWAVLNSLQMVLLSEVV
jgi:hypothetical protein